MEIEGYGISFELIGDDILYNIAHGRLNENCIEQFIGLHKKVLNLKVPDYKRLIKLIEIQRGLWTT